jgi:hypothetical protein
MSDAFKHGGIFLMRIALAICAAVVLLTGLPSAPAAAATLDEAFPAPYWRKGETASGFGFDCVTDTCVPPAHVIFTRAPANPAMAGKIRSGAINRIWAEKLAVTFRRQQGDKVTVLNFEVQQGQVPSWSMVYECNCEGRTNFISSRTIAGEKATMTFYSMATSVDLAQENLNKLIDATLGASER